MSGNAIQVSGELRTLRLVHCTLVPGWMLNVDGTPAQPMEPSLIVDSSGTIVEIDHCILGGIAADESTRVIISSSIVDAMNETNVAFAAVNGKDAGGILRLDNSARSDCVEKIRRIVPPAAQSSARSNARDRVGFECDFPWAACQNDNWPTPIWSERQQEGCVRFSLRAAELRHAAPFSLSAGP